MWVPQEYPAVALPVTSCTVFRSDIDDLAIATVEIALLLQVYRQPPSSLVWLG